MAGISDDIDQIQVVREDFMNALDEVQPMFGVNEEELNAVVQNGIIHFADHIHVSPSLPLPEQLSDD
jgi:vesicle-fusing ATPase